MTGQELIQEFYKEIRRLEQEYGPCEELTKIRELVRELQHDLPLDDINQIVDSFPRV